MYSFLSRLRSGRTRRLPLGVLFVTTPLVAPVAHAQVKTSLVSPPASPEQPLLTGEARPTSSISTALRSSFAVAPRRDNRALMMSMPDSTQKASSSVPQPVIRQPVPLVTAIPKAVATLPLETVTNPIPDAAPTAKPAAALGLILGSKALSKNPAMKAVGAPTPATRGGLPRLAANLPARGGLVPGAMSSMTDLSPAPNAVEAPAVSDSQRILLAQLDADLAKAQKRLDRADERLSDGQRQLGAFTNVLQSAMLEAGDDARGLHPFVRVAQRYLGTPYVWGGESARGFDCSGFIMRVMRDLGYKALPHSAAEQFRYGTPIAKPLLKAGDIVFFANTYKPGISHVGIYLGKGRFIHAANSHVGTIVSSLNEPKWVEKYAGARRLIRMDS